MRPQQMIAEWVPMADQAGTAPGRRSHQVNVLCGSLLTPGDLEALRDSVSYTHLDVYKRQN